MRRNTSLRNTIRKILKESCEDGNCIPHPLSRPSGKWKDQQIQSRDSYLDYKRKTGELDSDLFDDLYDNLRDNTFFSFENNDRWYNEDGEALNKNELRLIESLPVIDTISSWKEWINSKWFDSTHFVFSKISNKNPINIGGRRWGEDPIEKKQMYFERYQQSFGPLIVKKKRR